MVVIERRKIFGEICARPGIAAKKACSAHVITITGHDAICYAQAAGLKLSKYADPTEGRRTGLTVAEATKIADVDPDLIHVKLEVAKIRSLRAEAQADGDIRTVGLCDEVLRGNLDRLNVLVDALVASLDSDDE